jgi:regulator of chromosome condensation
MPPRRSSRAASAQPVPTEPAALKAKVAAQKPKSVAEKPRSRAAATTTRKRTATERSPSPPPKRSRGEEQNVAPKGAKGVGKPRSTSAAPNGKAAPVKKAAKLTKLASVTEEKEKPVHVQAKPYFNPLPTPPEKARPGLQLFVWGAGNCGQFGLGTSALGEIQKPRKQAWAEKQMEEGTFGEVGAGLESVAGGGMHTLFIDEKGTVSCES